MGACPITRLAAWLPAAALLLGVAAPARADLFFSRQLTETTGEVIRYDPAARSVVQTLPVAVRDIDGLALDPASGNLFIASSTGNALFRLDLASGALSPISIPIAPFGPSDLTFGPSGDLFLLNQTSPGSVIRYDVASNMVEATLTAGGQLDFPRGLAFGPAGDLFVSSGGSFNSRVFRLDPDTGAVLQTYSSGLNVPFGVAFGPSGDLFVANFGSSNVVRVNVATGASSVAASGSGLVSPTGVAFGPDGNLFVASGSGEVLVFNPNTGALLDRIPVGTGGPEYLTFGEVQPAVVPEPSSLGLLGVGCLSLLLARRLRRRRA